MSHVTTLSTDNSQQNCNICVGGSWHHHHHIDCKLDIPVRCLQPQFMPFSLADSLTRHPHTIVTLNSGGPSLIVSHNINEVLFPGQYV